jgi:3-hydroxybutyryl-CoA dehydrogenase
VGPFQLLDMTGIDLEYTVLMEKYNVTQDPDDKPSPAIVERYARGEYGKKSGKGFYAYS